MQTPPKIIQTGQPVAMPSLQVPTRLVGTPLLVCRSEADAILASLNNMPAPGMYAFFFEEESSKSYDIKNGVAVIPINGGLTYRGYGWYWRSTYGQIRKQFREAMADPDVTSILFDICSPGGEAAGCFDLVDEIHAARGSKPIYAVANEYAYSAAYAIASAADKVFLPRTGSVGSVGVLMVHYEQSKAEEQRGIKYTAIFAGARKNDFTMHEPLSKEAADSGQSSVNKTYELFVSTVVRNRNLSADAVRKTEAAIYDGDDAVAAGLADGVKTIDEVLALLASEGRQTSTGGSTMQKEEIRTALSVALADTSQKAGMTEMLQQMGFVPAQSEEDTAAKLESARQEAAAAARKEANERAVAIAQKCALAGRHDMTAQLIGEEITVEAAGNRILEARANNNPAAGLDTTNNGQPAGGADFLMADARRRAGIDK